MKPEIRPIRCVKHFKSAHTTPAHAHHTLLPKSTAREEQCLLVIGPPPVVSNAEPNPGSPDEPDN